MRHVCRCVWRPALTVLRSIRTLTAQTPMTALGQPGLAAYYGGGADSKAWQVRVVRRKRPVRGMCACAETRGGFMELAVPSRPILPVRAWNALRSRGPRYAWHKVLRRTLRAHPTWKRRWLYARSPALLDFPRWRRLFPRAGGASGPESAVLNGWPIALRATARRRFSRSAAATASCSRPCGRGWMSPWSGVDFSPSQIEQARWFLSGLGGIETLLARGEHLPFEDGAFDMVVTSAVILHNPPPAAEQIRREILRVARRFAAHNEETGLSYNRFGYDTEAWYRSQCDRGDRVRADSHGPRSGHVAVLCCTAWRRSARPRSGLTRFKPA